MHPYLPFVLFGLAFLALVVWLTKRNRQASAVQSQKLEQMGFTPCPEEADPLVDRVTRLENNAEYRYRVQNAMRAATGGKTIYFYAKSRHRQGQVVATDEFLFPLKRPSQQGLMLFVKPTSLPEGTATKLIGVVATGAWDSQPDDLSRLEIPSELKGTNIIGALGPTGCSIYDLIDANALTSLQTVGDCGALIVMCRGEWASFASLGARMPFDLDKIWSVLQQLVD
jgi:hypothetical protein